MSHSSPVGLLLVFLIQQSKSSELDLVFSKRGASLHSIRFFTHQEMR